MKKLLGVLVLLGLSGLAFGDGPFGIKWGMSEDEVREQVYLEYGERGRELLKDLHITNEYYKYWDALKTPFFDRTNELDEFFSKSYKEPDKKFVMNYIMQEEIRLGDMRFRLMVYYGEDGGCEFVCFKAGSRTQGYEYQSILYPLREKYGVTKEMTRPYFELDINGYYRWETENTQIEFNRYDPFFVIYSSVSALIRIEREDKERNAALGKDF